MTHFKPFDISLGGVISTDKTQLQIKYSRASASADSVSTVSVIRGLPQSEKKIAKLKN
jgi:hypothetical protein